MKSSPMWVVKLGGSLSGGQFLHGWLDALATHGAGRVVVVPGGGPFADQVRAAQQRWRFDDTVAHRMAMLSMAQYGLMLTGLQSGLTPATDEAEITHVLSDGRVPVWVPSFAQVLDVPRNWSVTSDSLAARLASRLGARYLILVKSVTFATDKLAASELAGRGVIDEALPGLLADADYVCRMFAAQDHAAMKAALNDYEVGGIELASRNADGLS